MENKYEDKNTPITYLVGVLLGVNAIKDAYLWIDSPDCFFFKNDFVQGNHDITSNLRKADGNHKALSTISDADNVIGNRNDKFVATLKTMAEKDFVKLAFVSSMPMSQVVGTDYDGIIKEVKEGLTNDKPIFNIPSRSMTDCWLEGYADLLFSLAKNLEFEDEERNKNNVAIVGNLFDRGEGDCIGNAQELKRILSGLGLNVVSVWLDGGDFESVLRIKEAGTIISLPYGRKAAKKVAQKLKADLIESDLPFGLDKTTEFINKIATHFQIEDKAEEFIKKELTENNRVGILKWAIPHTFFGKKISFYGDPYLLTGFIDLSKTLGFEIDKIYIHGDEKHFKNNVEINLEGLDIKYGLNGAEGESLRSSDLLITNSHTHLGSGYGLKMMQFGFPSYDYHVYTLTPYFGFKGTLDFINRIGNTLNNS